MTLQPGDIVLVRGRSWISKAIGICTRSLGEPATLVSHCELVVGPGTLETAPVVSADAHGVVERTIAEHHRGKWVAIYRLSFPLKWRREVVARARSKIGSRYPIWRLVMHLLDWLLFDLYLFRRVGRSSDVMECSALVAWAYEPYVHFADRQWWAVSPDDIADSRDALLEVLPWTVLGG
jgi:hypothetical protein